MKEVSTEELISEVQAAEKKEQEVENNTEEDTIDNISRFHSII